MSEYKVLQYDRSEVEEPKYDRDGYAPKTGFQSPTDDHYDDRINFAKWLLPNPLATIPIKVEGKSMVDSNINSGDILLVDKSLEPKNGDIVLVSINGGFTVRMFWKKQNKIFLLSRNKNYKHIEVTPDMHLKVEGVITFIIHNARINSSAN
jgi:DNA polymerase V